MTDYLEELLDLLTLEDEQETGEGWTAQAASLVLPRVLELPEGTAAEEGGSGEGGARSWPEGKSALEIALELEERQAAPALDAGTDQEAAISGPLAELDEAAASGGTRPVLWETGPMEAGAVLLEQVESRRKPALLQQAQELERQAGQAQALAQDRRSRALAPAFPLPSRGQASSPSQTAGETGAGQRAGGTAWPGGEEQARLVDLAFQRDSRRYDRGFSLY